jgi:hypothetical protein
MHEFEKGKMRGGSPPDHLPPRLPCIAGQKKSPIESSFIERKGHQRNIWV